MALVLAVDKSNDTQLVHLDVKPMRQRTSRRNSQDTKLNACAMSTLSRREGFFLACSNLAVA
jgi:hypothetical protein